MSAVWCRFRGELRARWPAFVAVTPLVGLATATLLTAVAGARRTASTVDRYLEATRPNDVFLQLGETDPGVLATIERLPQVETLGRLAAMEVFGRHPGPRPVSRFDRWS
jgi:hypothetical protein